MNKPTCLVILPLLLSVVPFVSSEALAAKDLQDLIRQCDACHGPAGHSERKDVPALAGISMANFKEAMAQFYYFERHCPGKRPITEKGTGSSTTMCSIASTLSDEEIESLAQRYNAQ